MPAALRAGGRGREEGGAFGSFQPRASRGGDRWRPEDDARQQAPAHGPDGGDRWGGGAPPGRDFGAFGRREGGRREGDFGGRRDPDYGGAFGGRRGGPRDGDRPAGRGEDGPPGEDSRFPPREGREFPGRQWRPEGGADGRPSGGPRGDGFGAPTSDRFSGLRESGHGDSRFPPRDGGLGEGRFPPRDGGHGESRFPPREGGHEPRFGPREGEGRGPAPEVDSRFAALGEGRGPRDMSGPRPAVFGGHRRPMDDARTYEDSRGAPHPGGFEAPTGGADDRFRQFVSSERERQEAAPEAGDAPHGSAPPAEGEPASRPPPRTFQPHRRDDMGERREMPAAFQNMRRGDGPEGFGDGRRGEGFGGGTSHPAFSRGDRDRERDRDRPGFSSAFGGGRSMPDAFTNSRRRETGPPGAYPGLGGLSSAGKTKLAPGQTDLMAYAKVAPGAAAAVASSALASTGAPTAAAPESDAKVIAKVAAQDKDLARTTALHKLTQLLNDYVMDTSKNADKNLCEGVTALSVREFMPDMIMCVVERGVAADRAGDRRRLACVLNVLRAGKKPVCTLDEVIAGLERAVDAVGAEQEPALRSVIEDACQAKTNPLKQDALSDLIQDFMAAGPSATALAAAAASAHNSDDESSAPATAAAPAPSAPVAASNVPAAATAAPAAAPAAPSAPLGDIAEIAAGVAACGKRGAELTVHATEAFRGFTGRQAAAALITAITKHVHAEGKLTLKAEWLSKEAFGDVLAAFCYCKMDASIAALYSFQSVMYENHFPKGIMAGTFLKLYEEDIMEEEAFEAWRDDVATPAPGKQKAIIQTTQFFTYLQEAEEEEEDTDPEVEEALRNVVRPNNSNKLR